MSDAEESSRRFRQRLQANEGFTQVNEAQRRGSTLMAALEVSEECDALSDKVRELNDQLTRSKALNRLTMIQNRGLLETVKHLKEAWVPSDPKESPLKENINPLVKQNIDRMEGDAAVNNAIEEKIENHIKPPRKPGPR